MEIPGPAGVLEAELTSADSKRCAVLCHPHPQMGGSMHDAVLDCVSLELQATGSNCLKFNFRGVGRSQGRYDGGRGEVLDLIAVLAWLEAEQHPVELTLVGYSFGASVVWHALETIATPDRVLLIAPPVGRMEFAPHEPACPVHAIAGTADAFVDQAALGEWPGVQQHLIAGADHFFMAHQAELRAIVAAVAK